MRIAVAGIYHETNTFSPLKTELADFAGEWVAGKEAFAARYAGTRTSMGGVIVAAERLGVELVAGLYAAATPGGMVGKVAIERLLAGVLDSIDRAADGIVVIMHGAMVAEGMPDVEGEFLARLRRMVGAAVPVAMTLDLHANISPAMVERADIIVGYDTYPHIDMFERAEEAMALLCRTVRGEIRPSRALAAPGMLIVPQAMLTSEGAMQALMEEAFRMERQPGVLNVTVAGGFPYSDVPAAGMSFVVTTDGDAELAERLAGNLAERAASRKEAFAVRFSSPEEAVERAFALPEGPVILTEGSDNVGGGAPGDATHLLQLLRQPPKPALIVIRDPEAAAAAHRAGVGGRFEAPVGGKSDRLHGEPVHLAGIVRALTDGRFRHVGPYMTGQQADMGKTAVVECGSLTVVLTEKRQAPWDLGHVRSVGLWPADFHVIVAKSAIAWQTAFGSFAQAVIHVESPGCCTSRLEWLPYTQLRRPFISENSIYKESE